MKLTLKNAAFSLALCCLASCANEAPWGNGSRGKGGIDLKLTADAEVKDALPSVRGEAPELVAPDVADFAIKMLNLDTEQEQTWKTLEEFNSHDGFDVGSYILTASYGDINECGFDKPFFTGTTEVHVLEGRETPVDVTATLGNAMLSIDYTDAFKEYFRDYSVTAHTDGHANVVFGKTETRAGFLPPGDINLEVKLTNPSGKTVSINPAEFPAATRHHYHVTFDVDSDPMGNAALKVDFDDSLTTYNVVFSLIEELYNAEAPVVAAEGFSNGLTVEALSGNSAPSPLKFETVCNGGLKKAVLKIAQVNGSTPYEPPFAKELDLMEADESTQYQLEQNGIKVYGIFKNPEKMAFVDVTDLPKHLPEGTFEITFTVTDKAGRINENPIVLNLATLPISLTATGGSANYVYPGKTATPKPTVDATVIVNYNGLNPEKCISFKNRCHFGGFKDCEIVSVKESTQTRGFSDKTYEFNIKVCDTEHSPLPMELYFNGEKRGDFNIQIIEPEYTLEADPFATYARFKVVSSKPEVTLTSEDISNITEGLTIYKDGEIADVKRDKNNGLVTVSGLTPNTNYSLVYTLTTPTDEDSVLPTVNIHTEENFQIPNGGFTETENIVINNLQVGGPYRTSAAGIYTNHASINRAIPTQWATINPKTCNPNSANLNTWFVVPSTYVENGRAVIRNVGYSHNGNTPAQTGNLANTTYYNTNSASFSDSERVSGELFLGSYSFTGEDGRNEGIACGSRPTSLSFEYTYNALPEDVALVEIQILSEADQDGNRKIISSNSMDLYAESSLTKVSVKLSPYDFGSRAGMIRLLFKSSNKSVAPINIPSGDALNDGAPSRGYTFPEANHYNAVATGSVLTIDNVKLNY